MDAETRKTLELLNNTVHTPGWDVLADDLETKIEQIKEELLNTQITGDLLKIAQGRILAYRDILSLPVFLDEALKPQEVDESDYGH
jgi:hypothetical protein